MPSLSNLKVSYGKTHFKKKLMLYNIYDLPHILWQKIRADYPLERIVKEIRRRTRIVELVPLRAVCLISIWPQPDYATSRERNGRPNAK
jgi:transposase-like protein